MTSLEGGACTYRYIANISNLGAATQE